MSDVEPRDLTLGPLLGTGGFGRVLVCETSSGEVVAMKVGRPRGSLVLRRRRRRRGAETFFRGDGRPKTPSKLASTTREAKTRRPQAMCKRAIVEADQQRTLLTERSVIARFSSAFVAKCRGAFQDRDVAYLVMEYVNGGDLYGYLHERAGADKRTTRGGLTRRASRFYLACVAAGLQHVHSHDIAWRDLKPENCLLDARGSREAASRDGGSLARSGPSFVDVLNVESAAAAALEKKGPNKKASPIAPRAGI